MKVERLPSGDAINERMTRVAMRVAFAQGKQLDRQDLLSLLLLCAALRRDEMASGQLRH